MPGLFIVFASDGCVAPAMNAGGSEPEHDLAKVTQTKQNSQILCLAFFKDGRCERTFRWQRGQMIRADRRLGG
jgi:hypothetical protein